MQWFKKWWQEKSGNPSNDETYRGGSKCAKGESNQHKPLKDKSQITLSRESICESSDKTVTSSSVESCSSSTSHPSIQSNANQSHRKSIHTPPIACKLRQQAKDLESLICGSVSSQVSSNHSINVEYEKQGAADSLPELMDPDDFFENPEEIRLYKESNAFIDEYIIIDVKEVEALTRQSTEHSSSPSTTKKNHKPVKYQTTEFSIKSKKVRSQSPVPAYSVPAYSLTSYCNDGYGLFYGSPSFSLSQFPETFCYRTFNDDIRYGRKKVRTKRRYKSAEGLSNEPATSSQKLDSSIEILEQKVDAFEKSLMGPLINEIPTPCVKVQDKFSIQKTFGLTDDGDIIVNVDHIVEEKGCGFLFARKINIYRSVEQGHAICEKRHVGRSLMVILKEFFYQLCKFNI